MMTHSIRVLWLHGFSRKDKAELELAEDAALYDSLFESELSNPNLPKKKKKRMKRLPIPDYIAANRQRMMKYWAQRYRLFSKYDLGIRMDPGGDKS